MDRPDLPKRAPGFLGPDYWDRVYRAIDSDAVGWFEPEPRASLEALALAGIPSSATLVDVGAGSSRLVEHLLDHGATDLTVVDMPPRPWRPPGRGWGRAPPRSTGSWPM